MKLHEATLCRHVFDRPSRLCLIFLLPINVLGILYYPAPHPCIVRRDGSMAMLLALHLDAKHRCLRVGQI